MLTTTSDDVVVPGRASWAREGSRALACDARIYVSVSVSALLCAVLTASENSDPVERLHGARGVCII